MSDFFKDKSWDFLRTGVIPDTFSPIGSNGLGDKVWKVESKSDLQNVAGGLKCISSSECASGFACVGGQCMKQDAGTGEGSGAGAGQYPTAGGGRSDCGSDPTSPCNQGGPDACQGGPSCSGYNPRECCGTRSCSFTVNGVTCQCGPIDRSSCNAFGDAYEKALGSAAPGGGGCGTCDECKGGQCTPLLDQPCYCDGGSSCGGPCPDCGDDGVCGTAGGCQTCATLRNYKCPCNKYINDITACAPISGEDYDAEEAQAWQTVYKIANKQCEKLCSPTESDKCDYSQKCLFFNDPGSSGVPSCGPFETEVGYIESETGVCVLCEKCEEEDNCECNSDGDCGYCKECGKDCKCEIAEKCKDCGVSPTGDVLPTRKYVGVVARFSGPGKASGGQFSGAGLCRTYIPGSSIPGMTLRFTGGIGITINIQYNLAAGTQLSLTDFGGGGIGGCKTDWLPAGACFTGLPRPNARYYLVIGDTDPNITTYVITNPVDSALVTGPSYYSCSGVPTLAPEIIESRTFCSPDDLPTADPNDYSVYNDVLLNQYGDW